MYISTVALFLAYFRGIARAVALEIDELASLTLLPHNAFAVTG